MFPKSFLVLIFFIVMDIILKSIKDKKKIEEARNKNKGKVKSALDNKQPTILSSSRESVGKKELLKDELIVVKDDNKLKAEDFPVFKDDNTQSQFLMEEKIEDNRRKKSKNQLKDDVLKGIIYSEILSPPKSFRNIKKSI